MDLCHLTRGHSFKFIWPCFYMSKLFEHTLWYIKYFGRFWLCSGRSSNLSWMTFNNKQKQRCWQEQNRKKAFPVKKRHFCGFLPSQKFVLSRSSERWHVNFLRSIIGRKATKSLELKPLFGMAFKGLFRVTIIDNRVATFFQKTKMLLQCSCSISHSIGQLFFKMAKNIKKKWCSPFPTLDFWISLSVFNLCDLG